MALERMEARKSRRHRPTILKVNAKEQIGSGMIGSVSEADVHVEFGKNERAIATGELLVKTFHAQNVRERIRRARHSLDVYSQLKSAGVKNIPTTYRILGPKNDSVLMTNLNSSTLVFVGPSGSPRTKGIICDYKYIQNFPEIAEKIEEDIRRASAAGIVMDHDAYLFAMPRKETTSDIMAQDDTVACNGVQIVDYDAVFPRSLSGDFDEKQALALNVTRFFVACKNLAYLPLPKNRELSRSELELKQEIDRRLSIFRSEFRQRMFAERSNDS